MAEIPEYVGYANDLVERVGERLERTLKEAVAEMATKSDLALIEERAQRDRQELAELRRELKQDEEKRAGKMRRVWVAIWSVAGTLIVASASFLGQLITSHH